MKLLALLFFYLTISLCSCANYDTEMTSADAAQDYIATVVSPNYGSSSSVDTSEETSDNRVNSFMKGRASIFDLKEDLIFNISEYLTDSISPLSHLNKSFYQSFRIGFPWKRFIIKSFNIPELEIVDANEPALLSILKLLWCRQNSFYLFLALTENIVNGKKSYKVISRPLIMFLYRIYFELTPKQQEDFIDHFFLSSVSGVKEMLGGFCFKNGHYDIAFEILNDFQLIRFISNLENREDIMEFFKSNPFLAIKYRKMFPSGENLLHSHQFEPLCKWIANCIIYDAPEEYYIEMFDMSPNLLNHLDKVLFLSANISEFEYPRIYAQIRILLDKYSHFYIDRQHLFEFLNFINEVRFGPFEMQNLSLKNFNECQLSTIAVAALFNNKKNIFLSIYKQSHNLRLNLVTEIERIALSKYIKLNCLKLIFELIAEDVKIFSNDSSYPNFLINYYAIKKFKIEMGRFCLEFMALENLLALGFPPVIYVDVTYGGLIFDFVGNIFSRIKVYNEETLSSFISDFEKSPIVNRSQFVPFELIKFISNSPDLIRILRETNIKFYCGNDIDGPITTTLASLPNFEILNQIFSEKLFLSSFEPKNFKNKRVFKFFEDLNCKSIAQCYFEKCEGGGGWGYFIPLNEFYYFQWRFAFSYWIKSDQRERIREIRDPIIIKMLRLEFPGEMNEILGPERI